MLICFQATNSSACTITANGPTSFCAGGSITLDAGVGFIYIWSNGGSNETIVATTSGTYCVTVISQLGTICYACITVTVNPIPTPTILASGPTTFCQGNSVTLNAGVYSSYLWSNGAITPTITVISSGIYTVTVTNAGGCTGTASQTITVIPSPNPSITASGPTNLCTGNSVVLSAGIYPSYHWSNGATTAAITVSTSGTYNVTVTNGNGCTGTASQVVVVSQNPVPTITANGPTTFCQGSSVILDAGLYSTYHWSNGITTETISITASGTYFVTVTTADGCTGIGSQTITVNANPTPIITPNGPTTFCQGGSVTLNAGVYSSYIWSNGESTQTIIASTGGIFSVTVTNANGCNGVASITLTVNPSPPSIITPNGPTTFCSGDSVMLDAGLFSSYIWNTGATNETISALGSQPYCVTITDANGCTGWACLLVSVYAPPPVSIAGPAVICIGHTITLTAAFAASYSWNTGATTQAIPDSTSGNYCITVTNSQGCTASSCQNESVINLPTPVITASGPTVFCQSNSVTLDAGAGFATYLWSNGITAETITINTSSNYIVTVTNAAGCTGTASQSVTVSPLITGMTIIGPTTACGGSNVILSTSSAFTTYLWSTGATTQTINITVTGIYYVTVSNIGGCTATAQRAVTILSNPMPLLLPAHLCDTVNNTLTVGAVFAAYLWSTGATTQGISHFINNGTYTVTVTSANGCTNSGTMAISTSCNVPTFPAIRTTSITPTTAVANWIQPACYFGYTIRISLHNMNVWTNYIITPNTVHTFSALAHNTTYDWQIQTNCNASGSINSGFSSTQSFTTLLRMIDVESNSINYAFNVYPNPANDKVIVSFNSMKEDNFSIRLIDITGRIILNSNYLSVIGENQYQMNLSNIAKGVYMVILQNKEAVLQSKIVVQ